MERLRRILVVSAGDFLSEFGGGQIYVKTLIDELINRGIDLVVAVRKDHGDSLCVSEYRHVKVVTYSLANDESAIERVLSVLDLVKPDVVHVHSDKSLFAEACHLKGIPAIITAHHGGIVCPAGALMNYRDEICRIKCSAHDCLPCALKNIRWGIWAWYPLQLLPQSLQMTIGRFLRRIRFIPYLTPVGTVALSVDEKAESWATIRSCAGVLISPSKAMAESLVRNGADPEKIRLIPHGITPPVHVESVHAMKDGILRFYFVGRICYVKGLHVMIKAFMGIEYRQVELHIIGEASSKAEQRYYHTLKRSSGSDNRIVWHGKVEYKLLGDLISRFDAMVHPTICLEAFGLTIAEAMSIGKPVVASRCGGAEDQIVDGESGVLVEVNDVESLRQGMIRLIDDDALRAHIAENAAQKVVLLSAHVDELERCYAESAALRTDGYSHTKP